MEPLVWLGKVTDCDVRHVSVNGVATKAGIRQGAYVPGPPKSEAGRRTVTIPSSQWHHIQTHLDRFTGAGKDAPLFYRADNPSRVLTNKVFATAIKKACEKAGIPVVSPHELRHTGLTLFGQTGATLADLKYRAGHSTVETVMIYQHSNQRRDSELADKM